MQPVVACAGSLRDVGILATPDCETPFRCRETELWRRPPVQGLPRDIESFVQQVDPSVCIRSNNIEGDSVNRFEQIDTHQLGCGCS